jgi:hypothetical protein
MTEIPHLGEIFDRLKRGAHLGPDDEPFYSALVSRYDDYAAYFAPLGLNLIRHEREFFYFDPENSETIPDTLPRIAIFSYILVDHAANQGQPIEDFIFGQNFLISSLPHFSFDRYAALLRQVEIHDARGLETILQQMKRIGWVQILGPDEFRFLRPFHRVFSRCIELAQATATPPADAGAIPGPTP